MSCCSVAACVAGEAEAVQLGPFAAGRDVACSAQGAAPHCAQLSLQPHVLPSSLLYLFLDLFDQPLLPDVLPSSLVELHLDDSYDYPPPPGVLPSSLRRLTLSCRFREPLQVGSLCFLFGGSETRLPPLQPGVLPSTLLGVDFTDRYHHPLLAGVIPPSVRWLRLPSWYRKRRVEAVLPAHPEVRWFSVDAAGNCA